MNAQTNITYVCPEMQPQACQEAVIQLQKDLPVTFNTVLSIDHIFPLLSDPQFHTDIISIDIEHLYSYDHADSYQLIETLRTLLNCTVVRPLVGRPKKRNTKILAVIGDDVNIEFVRDLNRLVDGFTIRIGERFSYNDIKIECQRILNGDISMPKQISDKMRLDKKQSRPLNLPFLTARQQQIYNLVVEKGASNKAIGRMLNITESTVKLHMTAILKKYRVRNRTQLAVFAKNKSITLSQSHQTK
jgi:DNA-binding NarL/FixJ family response regulator